MHFYKRMCSRVCTRVVGVPTAVLLITYLSLSSLNFKLEHVFAVVPSFAPLCRRENVHFDVRSRNSDGRSRVNEYHLLSINWGRVPQLNFDAQNQNDLPGQTGQWVI